jgi:DNA polymerase III subunit delta
LSPEQFQQKLSQAPPAPVYLFLGPEAHGRMLCRKALIERALPSGGVEEGFTRVDLDETTLAAVLDDARSMSLFASDRLIWVTSAETALPRRLTENDDAGMALLAKYLGQPTPGTVLVFDCSRYDFEGDDKAKLERVQKFYAKIPAQVEFRPYTAESARRVAQDLARDAGLQIGIAELGQLIDTLAADVSRIASEIEKLRLYAGGRKITSDDILQLVPNAQSNSIFQLVSALGRGDRKRSLDSLDTLIKQGEYLPLALTFLATQFRLALAAQEAQLRNSQQIQAHFTQLGIRIWRDRADQVSQTVAAFSRAKLEQAIELVYKADYALRDTRPDDRVVMETLVMSLTKN